MEITLKINPPNLMPWLESSQKRRSILLLDVETDLIAADCLRFELNIVFNPIAIRRGRINKVDYFVGSTGAEVFIEATQGKILSHSGPLELDVEYTNTSRQTRKSSMCLTPEFKSKDGAAERSFKPGEIRWEANSESERKASFSCSEMTLVPVNTGNSVRWRLDTPRGEKAVRDFLIGNLILFAECSWRGSTRSGRFGARPSDVRFFDDQRRPLSKPTSLLMLFHLWRKGLAPTYDDAVEITFQEVMD